MNEIRLFSKEAYKNDYQKQDLELLSTTDKEIGIGDIVKIGEKHYVICIQNLSEQISIAKEINIYGGNIDCDYTSNMTCPFCGYDRFEECDLEDEDITDCEQCGASIRYCTHHEISYSSELLEKPKIMEV